MIWLVSYPRSGNTFTRNVFYHVYGLASGAYSLENDQRLDPDTGEQYPIIKTHLLPTHVPLQVDDIIVYLVRDGRDSLVSEAHHRRDIVVPGSDWHENLEEAITAPPDQPCGNWSSNVNSWSKQAHLTIHFEQLIKDPIGQIEKLRELTKLPAPQIDQLPNFELQKNGGCRYGGKKLDLFFRKGEIGSWKKEMPKKLQWLFLKFHGDTLSSLGYNSQLSSTLLRTLYYNFLYRKRFNH